MNYDALRRIVRCAERVIESGIKNAEANILTAEQFKRLVILDREEYTDLLKALKDLKDE